MIALGVDIGGTRIKAGLVDSAGRLHGCRAVETPASLPAFRQSLGRLLNDLLSGAPPPQAVGIGCRGIIDASSTTVLRSPGSVRYLEGVALSGMLDPARFTGVPIAADNDARAAMAGEMMFGAARGRRNALLLTLGTGVGGAVLSNGTVLHGHAGVAGHLGHLTVDPAGPLCICGNRGCLETRFSGRAIESAAAAAIHRGLETDLAAGPVTCGRVFEAAAGGDPVAREILETATAYLAGALAGLVHLLDPEVIVLAGQMAAAGEMLLGPLRREVHARTRRLLAREVEIRTTALTGEAGVIGAAALAHSALPSRASAG